MFSPPPESVLSEWVNGPKDEHLFAVVCGPTGCGKTTLAKKVLEGYRIIEYNTADKNFFLDMLEKVLVCNFGSFMTQPPAFLLENGDDLLGEGTHFGKMTKLLQTHNHQNVPLIVVTTSPKRKYTSKTRALVVALPKPCAYDVKCAVRKRLPPEKTIDDDALDILGGTQSYTQSLKCLQTLRNVDRITAEDVLRAMDAPDTFTTAGEKMSLILNEDVSLDDLTDTPLSELVFSNANFAKRGLEHTAGVFEALSEGDTFPPEFREWVGQAAAVTQHFPRSRKRSVVPRKNVLGGFLSSRARRKTLLSNASRSLGMPIEDYLIACTCVSWPLKGGSPEVERLPGTTTEKDSKGILKIVQKISKLTNG